MSSNELSDDEFEAFKRAWFKLLKFPFAVDRKHAFEWIANTSSLGFGPVLRAEYAKQRVMGCPPSNNESS